MRLPLKKINIFSDSDTIQQSSSHKQNYFLSNEQKTLINKKKTLNGHKQQPLAWQFAVWRQTSKHVSAPVSQTPPFRRLEGEFQKS